MPKQLLPKSTVLAYIVRISSFSYTISILVAIIHSLLLMMTILRPGMLLSSPELLGVRMRNMFFANCWVMVDAPRAS